MMEQGTVVGRKITFHLKQFLRRTFSVGSNGVELDIREVTLFILNKKNFFEYFMKVIYTLGDNMLIKAVQ